VRQKDRVSFGAQQDDGWNFLKINGKIWGFKVDSKDFVCEIKMFDDRKDIIFKRFIFLTPHWKKMKNKERSKHLIVINR